MSAQGFSSNTAFRFGSTVMFTLGLALASQSALAAPKGAGDAYDLSVNVSVLVAIPALVVPAQAHVAFTAQAGAFDDSQVAGPLNLSNTAIAPLITLTTGILSAQTQWVPPSTPTSFMIVGSQAAAADVHLNAVNLSATSLLGLNADVIHSTSIVSGYCPVVAQLHAAQTSSFVGDIAADVVYGNGFDTGNLHADTGGTMGGGLGGGGGTGNTGLGITVTGTPFLTLPTAPAPNSTTCILGSAACLVLNEQTTSGDGITTASMSSNGLHLTIDIPAVLSANVIIAHSSATLSCN